MEQSRPHCLIYIVVKYLDECWRHFFLLILRLRLQLPIVTRKIHLYVWGCFVDNASALSGGKRGSIYNFKVRLILRPKHLLQNTGNFLYSLYLKKRISVVKWRIWTIFFYSFFTFLWQGRGVEFEESCGVFQKFFFGEIGVNIFLMYFAVKSLQIYYDKSSLTLFMSIIGNQKKYGHFFQNLQPSFPLLSNHRISNLLKI